MDWTSLVITLIINVPAFFLLKQQLQKERANTTKTSAEAKKTDAEVADVQVATSIDLIREMRTDIDALKKRMRCVEFENSWLRNGVGILIQQIRHLGFEPDFSLDSMPKMPEEN